MQPEVNRISPSPAFRVATQKSLFVSGFTSTVTRKQLISYFEKFGKIKNLHFIKREPNPFAFVHFQYEDITEKVLKTRFHVLSGINLRVREYKKDRDYNTTTYTLQPIYSSTLHRMLTSCSKIEDQIRLFCQEVQPTSKMNQQTVIFTNHLKGLLKNYFPNARVIFYGSYGNKCALRSSDYDVFLSLDGQLRCDPVPEWMFTLESLPGLTRKDILPLLQSRSLTTEEFMRLDKLRQLEIIHDIIIKETDSIKNVQVIKAKYPLLRFHYEGILCDLSIGTGIVLFNTKLICFYIKYDIRVKWLVLVILFWGKINNIISHTCLSNYAMVNLCLFYLMKRRPPLIPSVRSLKSASKIEPMHISGYHCNFSLDDFISEIHNKDCIEDLVHGFFNFYAYFPFDTSVISIFNGQAIKKEIITNYPNFKADTPICVQDPIEVDRNLTSQCRGETFQELVECFVNTAMKLDQNKSSSRSILTQLFDDNIYNQANYEDSIIP